MEEDIEATCSKVSDEAYTSDSSDSESDFFGFDVTDVRNFLSEASAIPIFESTPKEKSRSTSRRSPETTFESDLEWEMPITASQVEHIRSTDDSDADSHVSGEFIDSIFQIKKKKIEGPSHVPTSDDDIEGEFYEVRTTIENAVHHSSTQSSSDIDKYQETSNETSDGVKRKGKHRSSVLSPSELLNEKCCNQNCLEKLSLDQIQKARDRFCKQYPTYELQRLMILNWFDDNQPEAGKFTFSISGLVVCWKAWTNTLGITTRRFYNLKSDYLRGRRNEKHGSFGTIRYSDQTDKAIQFLSKYFEENCDYLPNTPQWHLSSNTKRSDVYQDMCRAMQVQGMNTCSNATFRSVWKTHFSHVKIPKENRFGKCDTCANIKTQLREDVAGSDIICKRKQDHRIFVRNERAAYLDRCAAGHQHPNKFISIAIDGMDQNKTELPFTVWRHTSLEKAWRLKVHVVGAIIHGRHPIIFLDYQQYSHDSNMTMNILMQALWIHREFLPSTLYLQFDNTCKENKNQFVFSFLAYLVETKVFEKIEACFLPVGHTHIDVDQMFSRLSVGIARRGAKTFQDLLRLIHTCYNQNQGEVNQEGARPQYARINHMYAIREWLQPYAEGLHYLRGYHHFKFERNEDEKCIMHFKPWCSATPEWDQVKDSPTKPIFKESLPQCIPDLIKPSFETVGLSRLENMVEKMTQKGILNEDEKNKWNKFLSAEIALAESYEDAEELHYNDKHHKDELTYIACKDDQWPIDDLIARKKPTEEGTKPSLDSVLRASEAYEKGEGLLPVYTGQYRPQKDKQAQVMEDQDLQDLEVGMFVALDMEIHTERPLIGEIKELLPDNKVNIQWYSGSWTTKWTPAKKRQGRNWSAWLEVIERDSVILFDFSLTKSGKLRTQTIQHLKQCYGTE